MFVRKGHKTKPELANGDYYKSNFENPNFYYFYSFLLINKNSSLILFSWNFIFTKINDLWTEENVWNLTYVSENYLSLTSKKLKYLSLL